LQPSGVRGHFFGQSSFATHCLATERNIVKVSKNLPLELLAPLGCGIQTGSGTVMNSLAVPSGASIAVFGTGAVGLAAVMAARLAGASPIIGVDLVPMRLRLALELGATHIINSRRQRVVPRMKKIAGGGVDYIVETTGDPEMNQIAAEALNPKSKIALIAGAGGPAYLPEGGEAISIIQGDAVPQQFIPKLIALYRAGKFPFDRLVKFYEFGEINRAIADAKRGKTIKPVLRIGKA
jgi:aryl-alcohol dehydrogenase